MPRKNNRAATASAATWAQTLEEELRGTVYCTICEQPIRGDHARRGEEVHPWCARGAR